MLLGDAEVMPLSNPRRVAQPSGDDVQRERVGQFGFSAGSEVLKQPWPRLDAGPFQDAAQLCPQIARLVPVARHDELRPVGSQGEGVGQFFA